MANLPSTLAAVIDFSIPEPLIRTLQGRPPWLLTDFSLNRWVVTGVGDNPNVIILFDVKLPGGKTLADYPHLLESIKRITYGIRFGPLATIDGGLTQAQVARNLIVLARWMIENQIDRFDQLTSSDIREYIELATFGVHVILNTESILSYHIDKLTRAAKFRAEDTALERREKSVSVFPVFWNNKTPMLGREQLLIDAGLEGIGLRHADTVVTLLDDLEQQCSFYQPPSVLLRMKTAPSLDALEGVAVCSQQLKSLLKSFDYLYLHRRYLIDSLDFDPFPLQKVGKIAALLGKSIGRTGTVPVKQAATLIERSIRWVLDYSPIILELKEIADAAFDVNPTSAGVTLAAELGKREWCIDGPWTPFPILSGQRTTGACGGLDNIFQATALRNGMTLAASITYLCTACAIVIAAFSARRASEVGGIKIGCIERDDAGRPWLKIFIHKTLQANSIVPVPEIVVAAIQVLEALSHRARQATGTPYLLQYNFPGTDQYVGTSPEGRPTFRFAYHLQQFGYFLDVPTMPDGMPWTFRPHQFRRFFAILYIWIYDLGDWSALSYHLRHFDIESTRRYVSEVELGQIIAVADREHTAAIMTAAVLGETHVSGLGGERLKEVAKRLYARMASHIQPVSERNLNQRILRFVERSGVSLHAFPWGYCAAKETESKSEVPCSGSQSHPDFLNATANTCGKCQYNLRTPAAIPYFENSIKMHINIMESVDAPQILRQASTSLVTDLTGYLNTVRSPSIVGMETK